MNCPEVQAQLSEYLDQTLDTIRSKGIENHLLGCVLCRGEAEGLADCIRQVRDLPGVEPPAGFSHRVMAHARAIGIQPPFWQRFSFAGKFPLPIQASAVVLIAVFAVLLYQKETAQRNIGSGKAPAVLPAAPVLANKDSRASASTDSSIAAKAQLENRSSRDPDRVALAQAKSGETAAPAALDDKTGSRPESVPAVKMERSLGDAGAAPRRAPIQAQEVATGREPLRPSGDVFGAGNVFGDSEQPQFRAPFSAERFLSPLSEPVSDVEFVVRRRPLERRDQRNVPTALRKRAELDNAVPADKLATPQSSSSIVEVRWFSVPTDRYEQFKKSLAAEATVESEKLPAGVEKETALKPARDLLIKVMILSPAER